MLKIKLFLFCIIIFSLAVVFIIITLLLPNRNETYGLYLELDQAASGLEFRVVCPDNAVTFKPGSKIQNAVLTEKTEDDGIWISVIYDFSLINEPIFLGYLTAANPKPAAVTINDLSAYTVNHEDVSLSTVPAIITIEKIENS